MIGILGHQSYRRLFTAQVIALLGTGLMTVALALLAYDLAGAQAGAVLGTALAIKMVAYVGIAPVAQALATRLPARAVLIGADLVRALVVLALPLVSEIWHIYVLVFVLQTASAVFTPAFQALIPRVLTDEEDYTKALSLSRLAYDLENLLSPAIAGLLLSFVSFHWLFGGTTLGFVVSALLIWRTALPAGDPDKRRRGFWARLSRGGMIYLATPRLRGLLGLNFAAAAGGSFVLVNTVVLVREGYGGDDGDLALAMAAFGLGSMLVALILPRLLKQVPDRQVMVPAALGFSGLMIAAGLSADLGQLPDFAGFLCGWIVAGALYAAILTPSGRLLRRSAHSEDLPAIFAAQFALSHACWLVTYPLAGLGGSVWGLGPVMAVLGVLGLAAVIAAMWLWPRQEDREITHSHPDLPPDHPHLAAHGPKHGKTHRHVFVIDDEHHSWPSHG